MALALGEAFADDPVVSHLVPTGVRNREARLRTLFALEVPRSQRCGGGWISTHGSAAAVWYPPDQWREPMLRTFLQGPASMWVFGRRLPIATKVLMTMVDHHPTQPHWYLLYIGTVVRAQGTGRGSRLLRAKLAECDAQGVPAYLEATSERNRDLYRRHGFVDREVLELPDDCPPLYPMWRDPA
jgi:GNAT superfamily N-acetyltransferase